MLNPQVGLGVLFSSFFFSCSFISLIISAYTSAVLPTRKKTLAQAASYGASAGSKIPESKRKNAVLDKFWTKIDDSTIEQVLRTGTADIGHQYLECVRNTAENYADDIFITLRKYEYNPDLMRLFIVGGGGCIIKNFGRYTAERVTILDDICATAKGYEYLAYSGLRRKERL